MIRCAHCGALLSKEKENNLREPKFEFYFIQLDLAITLCDFCAELLDGKLWEVIE